MLAWKKVRKKPVVVEAFRWDGTDPPIPLNEGCSSCSFTGEHGKRVLMIGTLEGVMRADVGDYVIRGVNGEVYPCKPDIFEKTYDPVVEGGGGGGYGTEADGPVEVPPGTSLATDAHYATDVVDLEVMKLRIAELETNLAETSMLAGFYRCCALSGEPPGSPEEALAMVRMARATI